MNLIVNLRGSILGKKIRKNMSTWPGYQQINLGVPGYGVKKFSRVVLSLLSDTMQMNSSARSRLKLTAKMRNTLTGQVLVIGNGPSASNITARQVSRFKSLGGKVLVMNDFINSDLASSIEVDFYSLIDPDYWNEKNSGDEFRLRFGEYIMKFGKDCKIIQPAIRAKICENHGDYLFVDIRSVAGLLHWGQPHKPWGYPASVALSSIAALKFLGYSQIYFAGLDSDSYKNFFVDDMNTILFDSRSNYFYSNQSSKQPNSLPSIRGMQDWPIRNMPDVLFAASIFLRDQKRLMQDVCINVGGDSTNDTCPRACLIE